jgi:hypothetical protein
MEDQCEELSQALNSFSVNPRRFNRTYINFLLKNRVLKKHGNIYIVIDNKVSLYNFFTKISLNYEKGTLFYKSRKCVIRDTDLILIPLCNEEVQFDHVKVKVNGLKLAIDSVEKKVGEIVIKTSRAINAGTVIEVEMKIKSNYRNLCVYCELDKTIDIIFKGKDSMKMFVTQNVMMEDNKSMVEEKQGENGKVQFKIRKCPRGFTYIFEP